MPDQMEFQVQSSLTSAVKEDVAAEQTSILVTQPMPRPASPVFRFCADHSLGQFVRRAAEIAGKTFNLVADITIEMKMDHEDGDEFIAINVPASGSPDDLYQSFEKYLRATLDFPEYAASRIRLMVDPV